MDCICVFPIHSDKVFYWHIYRLFIYDVIVDILFYYLLCPFSQFFSFSPFLVIWFIFLFFFLNVDSMPNIHGAWTHNPLIKSRKLHWPSQVPLVNFVFNFIFCSNYVYVFFVVTWWIAIYVLFTVYLESVLYQFKWNIETFLLYHALPSFESYLLYPHTLETLSDNVVSFAFSCQIYFKELRQKIFGYIYHFSWSSLISDTLISFLKWFFLYLMNFLLQLFLSSFAGKISL